MEELPEALAAAPSPTMVVEPVRRGNVADQIAGQIVHWIVENDLTPGRQLPTEAQLSVAFGVGKSAIREAIRIVATRGLIEVAHGSGMRVTPRERWRIIDSELLALLGRGSVTMEQLIEVRRILEPGVAAHAAERATADEIVGLAEIIGRAQIAERQSQADYVRLDLDFHDRLALAARNPIYPILMHSISALLFESRRKLVRSPDSRRRGIVCHYQILDAIRARDPEGAAARMLEHIAQVEADWMNR